jgi:hypothetical protein
VEIRVVPDVSPKNVRDFLFFNRPHSSRPEFFKRDRFRAEKKFIDPCSKFFNRDPVKKVHQIFLASKDDEQKTGPGPAHRRRGTHTLTIPADVTSPKVPT